MKEIKLMIVPQPGAKPEFLASVGVVDPNPATTRIWEQVPSDVILEGYTRDGWAWKPSNELENLTVQSQDGRNKLSGFLSYLQQRQKACYGRFGAKGLWVVSYVQPKQRTANETDAKNRMECRLSLDLTIIPNCNLKPKTITAELTTKPRATLAGPRKTSGGGLLGKLVGAQKRTNQHVIDASAPSVSQVVRERSSSSVENVAIGNTINPSTATTAVASRAPSKTAAEVMNEFRQELEQKMLDFDIAPEEVIKIPISLPNYTSALSDEEKPKITMEILKYLVYEAAEEVNEEWISHKEPSEFMDETVIAVYKEGAAPPEVLEEINKAEMPEEVKGQQRHMQETRMRQMNQAEQKKAEALEMQAHHGGGETFGDNADEENVVAALNRNKRDRRTIEDYERDKKRGKS